MKQKKHPQYFSTEPYNNRFRGKINGVRNESFSLENLEKEIYKSFNLTFQELQMMSNQTITLQNI